MDNYFNIVKKDWINEIKKQIGPILVSGLAAFLITVGNSLVGGTTPCIVEQINPELAGGIGMGLKIAHSSIKSFISLF